MGTWHRETYNVVAKQIREEFPIDLAPFDSKYDHIRQDNMLRRATLSALAIRFARRFKEDNPQFDPLHFLDQCSPDTDYYPLSELWEDNNE